MRKIFACANLVRNYFAQVWRESGGSEISLAHYPYFFPLYGDMLRCANSDFDFRGTQFNDFDFDIVADEDRLPFAAAKN